MSVRLGPENGDGRAEIAGAPADAVHGKHAAFQAAPRVVTDITATSKDVARRPGRRVFLDDK
jgi:hypothetical protein